MKSKPKKKPAPKPGAKPRFDRVALDRLAEVFGAFADGTRLALLQELMSGPKNVNQLLAAAGTTQANVSRQLKILHQAGLLGREQNGLFVIYSIADSLVLDMCNVACRKLNQAAAQPTVPEFFI
jgi:DNA-binding transcriptional ArsR family regulator